MLIPVNPYLILLLPFLVVSWFLGYLGRDFKYGFWGNFVISLVFTPVIGLIVLLAQDRRSPVKR
ncbi:hypothetical protein [Imhoffiella purpurea]|uniref:Uncharacterized protein n=1 Tax=Imhoffiella purpurea TaxID=1249627 RepID=W9V9H1_9GAMM|nr:hypothetical protein [Imhoffiella purpurea]EXJ13521.1 hypothetical protein D779_3686 [Imhoffiella purpurea]